MNINEAMNNLVASFSSKNRHFCTTKLHETGVFVAMGGIIPSRAIEIIISSDGYQNGYSSTIPTHGKR